jgi:hypothetical protein
MIGTLLLGLLLLMAAADAPAPTPPAPPSATAGMLHARGTFDVKLTPAGEEDKAPGATLGRATAAKQFHGDLEGTSTATMLTAMTDVKGSAGYVAIERVSGALNGRRGTFVLQHSGTMTRGAQQLSVTVVPDSGTGELAGLTGRMAITITEGQHKYDFEYVISEAKP